IEKALEELAGSAGRSQKSENGWRIFSILQRRIADPALAKLSVERSEADPQDAGGFAFVELGLRQDRHDVLALRLPIELAQRFVRRDRFADETAGQVADAEDLALAQDHGALDDVLELAHVALPGMRHERAQSVAIDTAHPAVELPVELAYEMIRKQRDVLRMLTKRRQRDMDDVQAIKEVAAEPPGLDFPGEIPVGARDDADVDPHGLRAADRPHLLLLDRAQKLHLQVHRHLADLIEKDRAVVGCDEQSRASLHSAGEGTLHVPEELAFQKRLRDGSAVDGNERLSAPRTGGVDGAGDQFLAGAALAGDEDVARGRTRSRDLGPDRAHQRTVAEQVLV